MVECGKIKAEPLVIRANAGDCIEIRLTNLLPEFLEESPFQMKTLTDIVGFHIHLVKFDTIVSDGAANGWNNIAGARQYETLIERFFADRELQTVFFHDPKTGCPLHFGTRAVIRREDGTSFREFALFVHDFAFLFDKDGKPLNPPAVPGSHDDPGVMGINYHAEPMRERLKKGCDPAYLFSSLIHGDPATPILETYPGTRKREMYSLLSLLPRPLVSRKYSISGSMKITSRAIISITSAALTMHGLDFGVSCAAITDGSNA